MLELGGNTVCVAEPEIAACGIESRVQLLEHRKGRAELGSNGVAGISGLDGVVCAAR